MVVSLAVAAGAAVDARADWPHLRGPNYDGVSAETGLADAWPVDGPPRLWARELGQGYSGFVVAAGKVYTQRQTAAGQSVLCLDPDTGRTVWEAAYDGGWQPKGAYPGPYASPTCYRDKVYYTSPAGRVGCLDAVTGAARWSLDVRAKLGGTGADFGWAATPLVEDDRVILPVGGPGAALVALHADDGRTLWATGSDPASYCPVLPFTLAGRRLVAGYLQNALLLVDPATGEVVYRRPLSAGYDEHSAWPLFREPHLMLTGPFRAPAVQLRLEAAPAGAVACLPQWTRRGFSNDVASSVLYREHVYGFDLHQLQASRHRPSRGAFKCLEWSTGEPCWETDAVGQAALLVADGKLILLNDSGELILARADPSGYHECGRVGLFEGEVCWTPPALWRGRLFVRSPSRVVCVYVGRPEAAPAAAPGTTSESSWRLDPAWLLSRERDYPNDAPSWEELAAWSAGMLVVLGGAAGGTFLLRRMARRLFDRSLPGSPVFWVLVLLLGLPGPNVLGALADRCVFTWPVSLYAAFHLAVLTCVWAEGCPARRRARWLARLAVAAFVLAGYGYFELCRAVGMFVGWAFLAGFPAALPLTALAARAERRGGPAWLVGCTALLALAALLVSGQALLLLKAARGG
jgi:outer membrane protein assembly factor BamB